MASDEPRMLWAPTEEGSERATITRFARWVAASRVVDVTGSYDALWRWSVDDLDGFWAAIWEFFEIRASAPYASVLGSREMPGAEWFPGAELNYAEHVFRMAGDRPAIVHASELRETSEWSWHELHDQSARIAAGLRRLGVERGDRVVAYMPNIPETVAALL